MVESHNSDQLSSQDSLLPELNLRLISHLTCRNNLTKFERAKFKFSKLE